MDEQRIRELAEQGLSQRQVAKLLGTSQGNLRYWSKKYNIKFKVRGPHSAVYCCRVCGNADPKNFYTYRKRLCGNCDNERVKHKALVMRRKVIEYLGGQCRICGYNRFDCALDVHHLDPSLKDPLFKHMRYWAWERVVKELEKCVLLCKNCHVALHTGDLSL